MQLGPEIDIEVSSDRRCLATGEPADPRRLIRFVISPEGQVAPDLAQTLPGRGMWVSADRSRLELAIRRNAFQRAARASVRVPPDLVDQLERGLLRRCLDHLGLLRRAGQAVFGFEKAAEWLLGEKAAAIIAARDGDVRDRARLRAHARGLPSIDVFSADEIARATGRATRTVHGAVSPGRLCDILINDAQRLAGVRGEPMFEDAIGGRAPSGDRQTRGGHD